MKCPQCNTSLPDDFVFCGNCGYNFADGNDEATETQSKPQMSPRPKIKSQPEQQSQPTPRPKVKSQQSNSDFSTINCPNCGASKVTIERTGRYRCNECETLFLLEKQQEPTENIIQPVAPLKPDWEFRMIGSRQVDEWKDFGWEFVETPRKGEAKVRRNRNLASYNKLNQLRGNYDLLKYMPYEPWFVTGTVVLAIIFLLLGIFGMATNTDSNKAVEIIFFFIAFLLICRLVYVSSKTKKSKESENEINNKKSEIRKQARSLL